MRDVSEEILSLFVAIRFQGSSTKPCPNENRLIREGRFADCVDELQPFIEEALPNAEQDNVLVTESMDVVINAKSYLS